MRINISKIPTRDIENLEISEIDGKNLYVKSKEVYGFEKCYGFVHLRSRVIRKGKEENRLFDTVKGGIIDAGFKGHLCFMVVLNEDIDIDKEKDLILKHLQSCSQLVLFPVKENYYDGTNQTSLKPEILFTT